jgi:hypothetical protein
MPFRENVLRKKGTAPIFGSPVAAARIVGPEINKE